MTAFVRLLDNEDKATALSKAAECWRNGSASDDTFDTTPGMFTKVPGSAFVYWVSDQVLNLFDELAPVESNGRTAKVGLQTSDDFRFARAWWEVDLADIGTKWFPFAKGGAYSPFYTDVHLVVNWGRNGREIRSFCNPETSRTYSRPQNTDFYFRAGLTWPYRPHRRGAFAIVPTGCVFSTSGMMLFAPAHSLWALAAILNSSAFVGLLHLLMPRGIGSDDQTLKYEAGFIGSVPVPSWDSATRDNLVSIAREAARLGRCQDARVETSLAFTGPELIASEGALLGERLAAVDSHRNADARALESLAAQLDDLSFELYGISGRDRTSLTADLDSPGAPKWSQLPFREDRDRMARLTAFMQWAVGVAFGRFDVGLATGDRESQPEPDPLDPLPVCSPAILLAREILPGSPPPTNYPLELPPHGVLVDDPSHPWDLVRRIQAVFTLVAGDHAHEWIGEVEKVLGRTLRDWLRRYGFERHLKRYSRSRRKAPLYWHLGPKSREYGIWLYSPSANRDTFYRIFNDYVEPKLKAAERQLLELRQHAGESPTSQQRKELTAQEALVEDLRAFLEQVALVAPLWKPHRDDGVVLNCAVLHRLFDHNLAWRKECAKKWEELADGKYDWAGWAMHLWPERVIHTCASDRSSAIAHGLEETLWVEGEDGKWEPRADAEQQVAKLVAERRSPAVQAALDAFERAG